MGEWLTFMGIFTYMYHNNKKARESKAFPKLLIVVNIIFGIMYIPVRIVYAGFEPINNHYKKAWKYKNVSVMSIVLLTLFLFPLYLIVFFTIHLPVRLFTAVYKYVVGLRKYDGETPSKIPSRYNQDIDHVLVDDRKINDTKIAKNDEAIKVKYEADIKRLQNIKIAKDDELKKKFIYDNSKRYTQLSKVVNVINKKKVYIPLYIVEEHPFSTRRDYDSEKSRLAVLHGYLVKNSSQVKSTLRKVQYNVRLKNTLHNAYGKIQRLPQLDNYESEESLIIKKLFNDNIVETNFVLTIKFSYTSPKGQSRHRTKEEYTAYELVEELKNIKESIDERTEFEIFRDAERAKVTPGVRYDILKRDNFMCQICGATADHGVILHVDHIVPVFKWGKSEESNLQTLCSDCNLGKGTKD